MRDARVRDTTPTAVRVNRRAPPSRFRVFQFGLLDGRLMSGNERNPMLHARLQSGEERPVLNVPFASPTVPLSPRRSSRFGCTHDFFCGRQTSSIARYCSLAERGCTFFPLATLLSCIIRCSERACNFCTLKDTKERNYY